MFTQVFDSDVARFLAAPPSERERYRTVAELDAHLDQWARQGARVTRLGQSRAGHPIRAAVIGSGPKTLLGWGYPHPDEPLGAEALVWLGDGALSGALSSLAHWRLVLVLCADPDETVRQRWGPGPRTAQAFAEGAWRPMYLDVMVDYGFPLDWGPFWQPEDYEGRCRTRRECRQRCGPDGCQFAGRPPGPLPESLALARAIDWFEPDVVASMHGTHTGGDYTFLLEREHRSVLQDLVDLPGAAGTGRHLGEPIDRGRRWLRDAPDLIVEPDFEHFRRKLERRPDFNAELSYQVNHSAAVYLQSKGRAAQFICPESAQFRHPDFADSGLLVETVTAQRSVEDRRRGRYAVTRVLIGDAWEVVHQDRTDADAALPAETQVAVTRGMLGVEAVLRRRRALAAADDVWARAQTLPHRIWHPYEDERAHITVPGAYVHDRSMLIFRTREDYRRPATRAQAASFRWGWRMHTATLMSNLHTYLVCQPGEQAAALAGEVRALQARELEGLPEALLTEAPRGPAMSSMLARVLRVCVARD